VHDVAHATPARARPRRPESRFRVVRGDDLAVVTADDDAESPVEYRFNVTRQLLLRAKHYVFDAIALVGVIVTQADIWTSGEENRAQLAAIALVTAGSLLFRRRAPFAVPLVVGAGAVVFSFVDAAAAYDTDTMFFVLLLSAWAAGSLADPRRAAAGLLATLIGGWVVFLRAPGVPWTELLWLCFPLAGIFVISAAGARHSERARLAEERAQRSEEEAKRAVGEERARISRELHDVVAHSVSVMTVQASAVRRLLKPDQEREREALQVVEETGRQALTEMRRLLGIMREQGVSAERAPQPGLATIADLVEHVREAGLPVELTVEGEPVRLPPGVDLSAYRIVQEALTNALRHAGPARAWVAVRYGGDDVEIEVENDGRSDSDGEAAGHGLVGMRERVALCGGELKAGPRKGGGFSISARLPVGGGVA
jgi:signal transduction histidine kinase